MRQHGFEPEFPPAVLHEVSALHDPSDDSLPTGVHDLRDLLWSSIDNRETRDLDQVEVAELLPNDAIRLQIGVADVCTLVGRGSAADDHAAANATSVYAGVARFPMLPERLSADLTSLNEGEDRFAIVTQLDVVPDGRVDEISVRRALVRNRARLTYDEVSRWLDGGPAPRALDVRPELGDQIRLQEEAARRLRRARAVAGALDVESVEARPVVARGKVVDLAVLRSNRARDLIEDVMVAANGAAAAFLLDRGWPSLRRVVREPKRWDRIVALAADVGEALPQRPDSTALTGFVARRRMADPEHFADLALAVVKLLGPGAYVIERRLGDRRHEGVFGVAVSDYVHATAPNRRFADLVTQRMLRAATGGAAPPYTDEELARIARHCTERSDAARKVERTMRKVAGATMLAERIGESFAAVITAASPKGTYARLLKPPIEGRIVRGEQGLDVGDTVRVTLVATDPERGYIDFAHESGGSSRKLERSRRKKAAADQLRSRIGETFEARVTGVSEVGTWVRLLDESAEGKVVRGYKPLTVGMTVPVRLIATDSVHGFIDFEYLGGIDRTKAERAERKRRAARALEDRIGDTFRAVVTGVSRKATWIRTEAEGVEGRLVRGHRGLRPGDRTDVVLLSTDPVRGFIDFARADRVLSPE
jgi:exoribonuclease-2